MINDPIISIAHAEVFTLHSPLPVGTFIPSLYLGMDDYDFGKVVFVMSEGSKSPPPLVPKSVSPGHTRRYIG